MNCLEWATTLWGRESGDAIFDSKLAGSIGNIKTTIQNDL